MPSLTRMFLYNLQHVGAANWVIITRFTSALTFSTFVWHLGNGVTLTIRIFHESCAKWASGVRSIGELACQNLPYAFRNNGKTEIYTFVVDCIVAVQLATNTKEKLIRLWVCGSRTAGTTGMPAYFESSKIHCECRSGCRDLARQDAAIALSNLGTHFSFPCIWSHENRCRF